MFRRGSREREQRRSGGLSLRGMARAPQRPPALKRAETPNEFQWCEEEEEATTSDSEEGNVDSESAISDESSLSLENDEPLWAPIITYNDTSDSL